MRFKNLPTSLASLSFTTKLASVTPMDKRHCCERKQSKQTKRIKGRYYETIDSSSNGIVNGRRFTCLARRCILYTGTCVGLRRLALNWSRSNLYTRAGQTKPQAHQSFQLACTFKSVWPGLYRKLQRIPKQINDKVSEQISAILENLLYNNCLINMSAYSFRSVWHLYLSLETWRVPMKYFLCDAASKTQHFTRHQLICDFATQQFWYFWKPTVSIIIQKHFGQLQNFQKFFKCLEPIRIWHNALYTKNHGYEGKVKHGRKQKLVHVYLTCLHRPWREERFGEIGSFYRPVWELVKHMHHCERIRDQLTYPGHRVKLCKFVFIRNLSRREDLRQSDSWTNGLLRRKNEKRLDKETKHCSFFATSYETYQSNRLVHISKSRPAIRCVKVELSQVGPSCSSSVTFGKST